MRDHHLRSCRVYDAFRELRLVRKLGRRLTDEEAEKLNKCQAPDPLWLRRATLCYLPHAYLGKSRDGKRLTILTGEEP